MIEKLRENAIKALTSEAYTCDGDCGLSTDDCFAQHPIAATAYRGDDVTAVDAEVPALVDIVFAAIGLSCDGQGKHLYLSTGCLHDDHKYCKSHTGLSGRKKPASCKHCGVACVCFCHQQAHNEE